MASLGNSQLQRCGVRQYQPMMNSSAMERDQYQPMINGTALERDQNQPMINSSALGRDQYQPMINSSSLERDQYQPMINSSALERDQCQPMINGSALENLQYCNSAHNGTQNGWYNYYVYRLYNFITSWDIIIKGHSPTVNIEVIYWWSLMYIPKTIRENQQQLEEL